MCSMLSSEGPFSGRLLITASRALFFLPVQISAMVVDV